MRRRKSYGKIDKVKRGSAPAAAPSSLRHTPTSRSNAKPIPMRQEQKGAKLTTYETRSIQHGEILASSRGGSSYYSDGRACKTKGGGPPRRGQIDLIFAPRNIPAGKHSKRPPPPGPALRFCGVKSGFASLYPVKDPREAKKVAKAYQSCLRDDPERTPESCVEEATGKRIADLPFGEKIPAERPVRRRTPRGPRASTASKTFLFPWQRRS